MRLGLIVVMIFLMSASYGCWSERLPTLYKLNSMPQEGACRIAVLPFVNRSSYPLADAIAYRVLMSKLVATNQFDVAQEGDVREAFQFLRIGYGQQPDMEQLRILGDYLRIKLFVVGEVLELAEPREISAGPNMAVLIKIIDSRTGQVLWSTYHKRSGDYYRKIMHYGVIGTVTGLADQIFKEVVELWIKEGFRGCQK